MTRVDTPPPAPGTPHPKAVGKFLFVGDRKLEVRGVTYGTFRTDHSDAPYPSPAVVKGDFREMAEAGLNAVRVYTPPPCWLLDEAMEAGLRVMVGLPWEQHVAFLDDVGVRRSVDARVRRGVSQCRSHPALLGYAIGNEIPAQIVRWSGRRRVESHLSRLYHAVKEQDPDILVAYVNYPTTEYLELPFLDVVAFNVFIESTRQMSAYVARLQNIAGSRALLLTELGLDSRRNGLDAQARLVGEQIRAAREGGCAGAFVFSWTDEWHRGGWDVEDWDFGLTTRERRPKPALTAARRELARPLMPPRGHWPHITVVVCVYNGERWIGDCLEGLERLDYPDFEVVVVDDGSTDETSRIVEGFDVRCIRTENRGLGYARNAGIEAAEGEIVAFIDADARPDEDWLSHVALALCSTHFVGVGGPNIAPPGGGRVASCVANAPGGPTHVLRTDREAEHIPGCNMAFRRSALQAIGGFDPVFRVAGDDVDVCWRLQERKWALGFCPGAVVWHHPRESIRAFWRQQRGYGGAEALLEAKWPEKYNGAGHVTWGGRVYGPPSVVVPGLRSRIYQGTWGEAPFQRLESERSPGILETAAMPEWYLVMVALTGLSLLGILWHPLLWALPFLIAGTGASVIRAVRAAARARFPDVSASGWERPRRLGLVVLLHLMQPLARLTGRTLTGLVPWRRRAHVRGLRLRGRRFALWRESGEPLSQTLRNVERNLHRGGSAVRRGGGYDHWDLQVDGGNLGFARLRSCTEEHGQGRQLFRADVRPRLSLTASLLVLAGANLTAWSALDGARLVAGVLAAATLLVACRTVWECVSSTAALTEAVVDAEAGRMTQWIPPRSTPPSQPRTTESRASREASLKAG